jgi:DNA-binding YbaB/EbfC family protein
MFGALGGLANMAGLMKQAREMGSKMEALQEDLRRRRVVGAGASNLVEVEMNGVQEVTACRIDPRLLAQNDGRQVELLVRDAVNDAIVKSKQMHAEALKSLTGGMDIPGLDAALGKLTGG